MKNVFILLAVVVFAAACSSSDEGTSSTQNASISTTDATADSQSATSNDKKETETMTATATPKGQLVLIKTDFGNMKAVLYDETPKHRDNFIKLVKEGFYNDLLFHRVIKDFMIQGGDPDSRGAAANARLGSGGPGYTIDAEFNDAFIHKKGALSAARQGDAVNPKKASSGSQFYIVQGTIHSEAQLAQRSRQQYTDEQKKIYAEIGGTPFLDQNYTVFGEVIEGLDVIDKIAAVQTAPGDRPVEDVKMTMELVKK